MSKYVGTYKEGHRIFVKVKHSAKKAWDTANTIFPFMFIVPW